MNSKTASNKVQLRRLVWAGPLTILASILGVLIVRVLAVAILRPDPVPMSLGWVFPTVFTFVLVTGGVLVFALVARFAATPAIHIAGVGESGLMPPSPKNPLRTFQIIAFVFLLVSFLPDIGFAQSGMPGANWPDAAALMVMHVAAWAICVSMLSRLSVETA